MEGDYLDLLREDYYLISIHSLRMEGDAARSSARRLPTGISIHSLRMEGDWMARPRW